jgi:crossover junction endodeoxyribonuclease RuvC
MRILGIDPGSTRMGFGIIDELPTGPKLIECGVTDIKEKTLPAKLQALSKELELLLEKYKPDFVGVEKLFFSKNRKTALEVAHARGVIISALVGRGLNILELSPNEIKIAVTSYGRADKEMVRKMVSKILGVERLSGIDDAVDALAIALATGQLSKRELRR